MRRILSFIFMMLAIIFSISAVDDFSHVVFRAVVPEDYGVVFPKEAIKLDKLVFELPNGDLVAEVGIDSFVLEVGALSLPINILYYGNSEKDYTVTISADSDGWIEGDKGDVYVPVDLSFENYYGASGITAEENIDGSLTLNVPATGARHGDKVGTLILSWEYPINLIPGEYEMNLNLSLRSEE